MTWPQFYYLVHFFVWQRWFLTWLSHLYAGRLLIWWEMVNKSFSGLVITSTITRYSRRPVYLEQRKNKGKVVRSEVRSNGGLWIMKTKVPICPNQQTPFGKSSFFVYLFLGVLNIPSISSDNSIQSCQVLFLPKRHLKFILTKDFSYFQQDTGSE